MLENLHQVAEEAGRRYENEFTADDFILSDTFKTLLANSMRRDGQTIDYTNYAAVVTTTGALRL